MVLIIERILGPPIDAGNRYIHNDITQYWKNLFPRNIPPRIFRTVISEPLHAALKVRLPETAERITDRLIIYPTVYTALDILEIFPDLLINLRLQVIDPGDVNEHGTVFRSISSAAACGTAQDESLNGFLQTLRQAVG